MHRRTVDSDIEIASGIRNGNYSLDIAIAPIRFGNHSIDIPIAPIRFGCFSQDSAINVKRFGCFTEVLEFDDMPIGCVYQWAGTIVTIPSGFLLCNGASILRASYPNLFTAIGTVYGSVDGTHFNLPDLRDRIIVGAKQDDAGVPKTNVTGSLQANGGSVTLTHANGAVTRGTSGVTVSNHGNHTHAYGTIAVAQHATNAHTHGYGTIAVQSHTSVSTKQGSSAGNVVTTNTHTVSGSTGNASAALSHTVSGSTDNENAAQTHTVNEPNAGAGHDHAFTQPDNHSAIPPFLSLAFIIRGI